jgi:putative ABC transport system substrate-binding protein
MLFALCFPAEAQQKGKVPRVGYLAPRSTVHEAFRQRLRELGYVEGKNIVIEHRSSGRKFERFPGLAAELVRLRVDVIATVSTAAARAAKEATTTIPIVMFLSADPVSNGLVTNLARPEGNITGVTTSYGRGQFRKRLELLKEVVPKLTIVGFLWTPSRRNVQRWVKRFNRVERLMGLKIQSLEVRSTDDFESAFQAANEQGVQGLIALRQRVILRGRKRIVALAIRSRLPAIHDSKRFVKSGGLMSYGASRADLRRRQANYVDRILKGAKPGDLPIEQPKKLDLVINLKTAKQIGVTIPPSLLYQADEVIQ